MQIDLNDIQTFVTVAETGTFSAAAREMQLPTSTVSRAMTRLETTLGIHLFHRSQRGPTLTEAGKQYLLSCQRAMHRLRQGRELMQEHRSEPSGLLRVKCPITLAREVLMPLLGLFFERYPKLRIRIDPYCSDWDQEPREEVDVFFKLTAPRESRRRMRVYPCTRRGVFAGREYLKRHGIPYFPEELPSHTCFGAGLWRLTRRSQCKAPKIDFVVVNSDPATHLYLVRDGQGIALLPLWMAGQHKGELVRLLPEWEAEPIPVWALYFGASDASPKVKAFLTFMDEFFGTSLDPRLQGQLPAEVFKDVRPKKAFSRPGKKSTKPAAPR